MSTKQFASQADLEEKTVTFEQLSEHAWAYTAEGDPNSGVIIGDDFIMVSDATATPAMARDLRSIGIEHPRDLAGRDGWSLFQALCRVSGKRQDPCVLDTFMAATDFMRGAAPAPWWAYTAQRKQQYPAV